jgi:hypothetical protein
MAMTKEQKSIYQKQYHIDNADRLREQRKEYWKKNKVILLEKNKAWKAANPEIVKSRKKKWDIENNEHKKRYKKEWNAQNKEHVHSYNQMRKNSDSHYDVKRHLKEVYGISLEEYNEILAKQSGVCAICGEETHRKKLFVDHDHDSGAIRGLLCQQCNTALGMVSDNIDTLSTMISYLISSK